MDKDIRTISLHYSDEIEQFVKDTLIKENYNPLSSSMGLVQFMVDHNLSLDVLLKKI